ncbi:MAG: hypothetical protein K0Q71_4565 [Thermomicrobiales bacterium]|jgi:hypothetical protein|nr:hypothetical protein [Thermomicrobiales bacterium]
MDAQRFDRLTKVWSRSHDRRAVLRLVAATVIGAAASRRAGPAAAITPCSSNQCRSCTLIPGSCVS